MSAQDGGSIHPNIVHRQQVGQNIEASVTMEAVGGLTKRDWFAGMALQGYLAGRNHVGEKAADCFLRDQVAKQCFGYADAMLAAREGKEEK